MNNRIYLLGDSFTDNLYKEQLFSIRLNPNKINGGEVRKYVEYILKETNNAPFYFDDWLSYWGYDVYNFGLGGCSIYHTFNQFAKIHKNFIKGDRIIVNWTSPTRLDWLYANGDLSIIQGAYNNYQDKSDAMNALIEQDMLRRSSFENSDNRGYLKKNTIPFMSKLVSLHEKYKPIQWSPFGNVSNILSKEPWYFYEAHNEIFKNHISEYDYFTIWGETDGKCDDLHYSRYGNYYTALIFKTILEYNKSTEYYISDDNLLDKIFDIVKNEKPKFKYINWKNVN